VAETRTPEQIAYDDELARIESMPLGSARQRAQDAFDAKYPNGRPVESQADKERKAEVAGQAFGFMKAFLAQYPNDAKLQSAWLKLLANDLTGAKLDYQASEYYKSTSSISDQRLKQKLGQFGVYTQELNKYIDEQIRRLTISGIKLDPNSPQVKALLETAYLNNDNDNQIDIKALAFTKGKTLGGQAGQSIADLRSYAKAFGIKYSDADYNRWSEEMFSGTTTAYDIQAKMRQDSASAFPVYANQILNGTSVDSIGSAYKNSFANILELDPDAVDWNEPILRKALQYTQNGQPSIMPLWQFEQDLRKDPRWQYTNNARESVFNAVYQTGYDLGVL
jgi:hypothetical protein